MSSIFKALLNALHMKGVDELILTYELQDEKEWIESNFKIKKVFDRRSAAYFAMGVAQQSQKPITILVNNDSADATDLLPGITEAFYQKTPVFMICIDQKKEWMVDSERVIGDKCVYSKYLDGKRLSENEMVAGINESVAALTDFGGGPVWLRINRDDTISTDNICVTERICEENVYSKCDEFSKVFQQKRIAIALDNSDYFDENDIKLIDAFCNEYSCTIFASDIHLASKVQPKQNPEQFDLLLQIGMHMSPELCGSLKAVKGYDYWRVAPDKSFASDLKPLNISICCEWREFLRLFVTTSEYENTMTETFSLQYTGDEWNPRDIAHKLLSNSDGKIKVYGQTACGFDLVDAFRACQNVYSISNTDPTGEDGKLSIFVGQSLAVAPETIVCFLDDRSFFLDMNALHIQHISTNARICLFVKNAENLERARSWAEICGFDSWIVKCMEDLAKEYDWLTAKNANHPRIVLAFME